MAVEGSYELAVAETIRLGEDNSDYGWIVFGGVLLLVLGCANIVDGVAAISGSHFYLRPAHYVFGDLTSYGWIIWILGLGQALTALGVAVKLSSARWLAVGFACVNAIVQLLMIQAYPLWSLALFSLDVLVMYAFVVHGGRRYRPA